MLVMGSGCMPNPATFPKGPDDTKTGYSVTYKLNGRTHEGEIEAAGGVPTAGAEIFRAAAPEPKEPRGEKSEKAE